MNSTSPEQPKAPDPTDSGTAGVQTLPTTPLPIVVPAEVKSPADTLPAALEEAQEVAIHRRPMVLIQAWAKAVWHDKESERRKADRLQSQLTDTKVSLARLEERLDQSSANLFRDTVIKILAGVFLGRGITIGLDGNYAHGAFWILIGLVSVAAVALPAIIARHNTPQGNKHE